MKAKTNPLYQSEINHILSRFCLPELSRVDDIADVALTSYTSSVSEEENLNRYYSYYSTSPLKGTKESLTVRYLWKKGFSVIHIFKQRLWDKQNFLLKENPKSSEIVNALRKITGREPSTPGWGNQMTINDTLREGREA